MDSPYTNFTKEAFKTFYKEIKERIKSPGVELTAEEYEALSEEEKLSGKLFFIKDEYNDKQPVTVELTLAQYEALSSREKLNGQVYFITDDHPGNRETHVELTKEAYDALPEEEKMSGKVFFVKDVSESMDSIIVEITQEAYDALPKSEQTNGKLYMITDHQDINVIHAPDIFDRMNPKGEINSSALPAKGEIGDYYYLLDKYEGRYWDGTWKIVR